MRNSDNSTSNDVVKNLNKLVYEGKINRFRETLYGLSYNLKQYYLHTTIVKYHAEVMYRILSSVKRDGALSMIYGLFHKKKVLALSALNITAYKSPFLSKILFSYLNSQQKEDYKMCI